MSAPDMSDIFFTKNRQLNLPKKLSSKDCARALGGLTAQETHEHLPSLIRAASSGVGRRKGGDSCPESGSSGEEAGYPWVPKREKSRVFHGFID